MRVPSLQPLSSELDKQFERLAHRDVVVNNEHDGHGSRHWQCLHFATSLVDAEFTASPRD
jgi:hypothetical protein